MINVENKAAESYFAPLKSCVLGHLLVAELLLQQYSTKVNSLRL